MPNPCQLITWGVSITALVVAIGALAIKEQHGHDRKMMAQGACQWEIMRLTGGEPGGGYNCAVGMSGGVVAEVKITGADGDQVGPAERAVRDYLYKRLGQ